MLIRSTIIVVVSVVVTFSAGTAWAAGGTGYVRCSNGQGATGQNTCDVSAAVSGSTPPAVRRVIPKAIVGNQVCTMPDSTKPVPCTDPQYGWLGSNGCYYKAVPNFVPDPASAAQVQAGVAGAWYDEQCGVGTAGGFPGTGDGGVAWIPNANAGVAPADPAVLAAQARNELTLPSPVVRSSPAANVEQLVDLPVWLWIAPETWAPRSATAAVPGVAVTATATPMAVTWQLGDGSTVHCNGPGTPYPGGGNPAAGSPTCGHVFTRSSAGLPGGVFTGSVTVSWQVTWAGAGQAGVVPALAATTPTAFRVAESQALVVAPGGVG
jgi:hypothetical protein